MARYDSVIIGHITVDSNTDCEGNTTVIPGGAVVYSSASAWALGHRVAAVTKVASADKARLAAFTVPEEDIFLLDSKKSTNMVNIYHTPDKERRTCRCESLGDPFCIDEIPEFDTDIYHFAGLIYGDFSGEMIMAAAKRGKKIAVDVQALLRHASPDGSMFFEDYKEKNEVFPYVDYLKTDAAEAEILTGLTDRKEAAKALLAMGAREVLITHNTEVLAYDGGEFHTCPIKARNLSGRTGRGDTTFAAYINERLNHSIPDALLTATATVSLKMETPGPLKGTRADIEDYIRRFY